jgi:undecaprenyl-diphosphatase
MSMIETAAVEHDELEALQEEVTGYVRSPSDVLRLAVFAIATLLLVVLSKWARDSIVGFEDDLLELFDFLNPTVERILLGLLDVAVIASLAVIWITPLVTKRYRLFGYIVAANAVTFGLMALIDWFVDAEKSTTLVNEIAERAGIDTTVTVASIAQTVASFTVVAPFVSRRWRRFGVAVTALIVVLRLLVAVHVPLTLFVALTLGVAVGAAVLFAFGRPSQRPTRTAITASLRNSGLPLATLEPAAVDARGSTPYFATLDDGGRVFAKVLGADERAADLMFRVYRFIALKNVGDERPFSSLRRTVEHEALVSLLARDVGVRTPRMRAIADVGRDSLLLSYDLIDGKSVDRVPPEQITDDVLRKIWEQVGVLRRHRIAHRDLRRANIFLDSNGDPWIIDFGFSEVAASEALLNADVAQLVAALALHVGVDRAVDSAIAGLGTEAVGAALPRLQPNTLSGATRTELKKRKGMLNELQQAIVERCAVEEPEYEQLQRLSGKTIFTILMLTAVTYFLLPQLADVPGVVKQIRNADWKWIGPVLLMSVITYVGASMSLTGAIPDRIRAFPTFLTQLGSSFASKLAPAGLGGMALNVRFLQKEGVDLAVATSGVGLNSVGGLVMHVTLLVVFAVWAGRSVFGSIKLPDPEIFLIGVAVVLVLAVIALAFPVVRRLIREKLFPLLRKSLNGIGAVLRRPGKLALLLGGSAVVTLSYITCTYFSTQAFGGDLRFATVGAVYLAGAAVATAAPTPGGLGALEAALIAGLVAAGLDKNIAVPAVFLYRLATFWLPILPGWLSFTWLRKREYI